RRVAGSRCPDPPAGACTGTGCCRRTARARPRAPAPRGAPPRAVPPRARDANPWAQDRSRAGPPRRLPPPPRALDTLPYMTPPETRGPVGRELSRRDFMRRATTLGAGAVVLSALPIAERMIAADL